MYNIEHRGKGGAGGASKDLFCEFCIQYTVVVRVWCLQ